MKKAYAIENLELQVNKKIKYYLDSYSPDNALIIFDHGLGDAVEFFSIFNTLKKDYPKWNFKFGFHPTLGFKSLHEDVYEIKELNDNYVIPYGQSIVQSSNTLIRYNIDKLTKKFKFVFCIQFPDSRHPSTPPHQVVNVSKLDRCKVMEVGYDDKKVLETYTPPFKSKLNNEDSKIVIYHVGGKKSKKLVIHLSMFI